MFFGLFDDPPSREETNKKKWLLFSRFRKVLLLLVFAFAQSSLYGQFQPQSGSEVVDYFLNNKNSLDPIEGVYNEMTIKLGENSYTRFPPESHSFEFLIYKYKDRLYHVFGNDQLIIAKGDTPSQYFLFVYWPHMDHLSEYEFWMNGNKFDVATRIPSKQMQYDLGDLYQSDFIIHIDYSFARVYP